MINLGTAIAYLDLDHSAFTNGLHSAMSQLNTFASGTATASDRLTALGSAATTTGKTMSMAVTLPLAGLGTAAVKTAADFEASLSKVQSISGATSEQMGQLADKAKQLGIDTKFSAKEATDAFTFMAAAGWDTQSMLEGVDGIMALSAADGLDLATTADIVTDSLTAFGLSAADSAHFSDVLAMSASASNTNVAMLGESFKYIAPVAGAMKYSVEDTSIALGLMANAGIKGSQAGTSLRAALTNMISPTSDMAGLMKTYGISLTDADGNAKSLMEVMSELREKLGGLDTTTQAAAASTLFGKEAMSGMLAIINASDSDFEKLTGSIYNADGAAKTMADVLLDNLDGSITILKSSVEGLSLSFGEILIPMVRGTVDKTTEFVNVLNSMSEETKKTIIVVGGIAAALGPALIAFGSMSSGLGKILALGPQIGSFIKTGSGLIGGISAPVLGVTAAIAAVVAILVYLYKTNDEFKASADATIQKLGEFASAFMESLEPAIETVKESLSKLWEALQPLIELIGNVVLVIINALIDLMVDLQPAMEPIMLLLADIIDLVAGLVDVITGLLTGDFSKVSEGFEEIWNSLSSAAGNAIEAVKKLFEGLGKFIGDKIKGAIGEEAFSKLAESFGPIKEKIVGIFDTLKTTVAELFSGLGGNGSEIFGELLTELQDYWDNDLKPALEVAWEWLKDTWESLQPLIQGVLDAVGPIIENIGLAFENVGEVIAAAIDLARGDFDGFEEHITTIGENIKQIWSNTWEAAKSILEGWGETVKNLFQDAINHWVEVFEDFGANLHEKWEEYVAQQEEKVEEMKESFETFFTETVPGIITGFFDWLKNLPEKIGELIADIILKVDGFLNGQKEKGEEFKTFIESIPTYLAKKFLEFITNLTTWFMELPDKLMEAFETFKTTLEEWFPTFVEDLDEWFATVIEFFETLPDKWKEQAKKLFTAFWDGLKEVGDSIKKWFDEWVDSIFAGIKKVIDALAKVKANKAAASASSGGSHASGLDYVPYDGYTATLHRGERVVTAEENEEGHYNSGNATFIQNIYSNPRASRYELKQAAREVLELGGIF